MKTDDPLWYGMQCRGGESPCCAGALQFCRNLNAVTVDDLYMRLMTDSGFNDEDVPVHFMNCMFSKIFVT